jgi:CRP-like cAMP-binding protein
MTSYRQIEANHRNALKSTGPKTEAGKQTSRCNAVRHGLTAETVIGALEDAEEYKAFEAAITADYDAQSAVERELVLRLASILWRLRRATTMETGLFEIQAHHLENHREHSQLLTDSRDVIHTLFRRAEPDSKMKTDETVEFARCFLLLANLPNFALDRLSRYEATLWRQAGRILFALDALDRRKPQERMSRHRLGNDIHSHIRSTHSVIYGE